MRQRPRPVVRSILGVAAVLLLAGCLNVTPETGVDYQPTDGGNADAGELAIRNVTVQLSESDGAEVVASIVNTGTEEDEVVSVTVGSEQAAVTGDTTVGPRSTLRIGPGEDATAIATGVELEPGRTVPVRMSFSTAPEVEVPATVLQPTDAAAEE